MSQNPNQHNEPERVQAGMGSETIATASGMARASTILGFLSLCLSVFTAIPAIILGIIAIIQISRSHGRLKGTGLAVTGLVCGVLFTIVTILVALLLTTLGSARDAARRNQSISQMEQLNLSLLNYHDVKRHFPAHAIYSDDGKPLLSWRVAILPYMEEQALYTRFHLDEPWDSEHNRALISEMPDVLLDPSSKLASEQGKTHYVGPVGKGLVFTGTDRGMSFRNITDGPANTITLLQVNDPHAVIWTKPKDWTYDEKEPLRGLDGSLHPGLFLVGFVDGDVRAIPETVNPEVLYKLLTVASKEQIPDEF